MDPRRNANPDTLPYRVTFINAAKQEKVLAAFRLETYYKEFLARCNSARPADVVRSLVDDARESTSTMELAGAEEEYVSFVGAIPYDELLRALQEGIAQVEMLKNHRHEWAGSENGPSYCSICGHPGDI